MRHCGTANASPAWPRLNLRALALARQRLCRHLHSGCAGHAKSCSPDSPNTRTDSITAGCAARRGHAAAIAYRAPRYRHAAANAYRAPATATPQPTPTALPATATPQPTPTALPATATPQPTPTRSPLRPRRSQRLPRSRLPPRRSHRLPPFPLPLRRNHAYRAPRYRHATAHTYCTACDGYAVAKSDTFAANPDSSSDASAATRNRPRLLHRHLVVRRRDESALR